MLEILTTTGGCALVSCFLLLLLYKWGVIEWLQIHGCALISKLAGCQFCLSWWANVIVCVFAAIFSADATILAAAILATPITRKLL